MTTIVERTLATSGPFAARELLGFLAARAVPGVETVVDDTYARTLMLPGGPAVLIGVVGRQHVRATVVASDPAAAEPALEIMRRILDLDADPAPIDATLRGDALLRPLIDARPGLRSPGAADGYELLVRAITGQQVSVAGARTTLGRMACAHGTALPAELAAAARQHAGDGLAWVFPQAQQLAGADPAGLGMPRARGAAIVRASEVCGDGLTLAPGVDVGAARETLLALPGVGPWTVEYVAMRALKDPDAFLASDLGVRHALFALGGDGSPRAASAAAEAWRPYRAYANHHLWASL
jgi:AraC family transcriptional regulator, regulatory protein of adaptative response / DNA-3-methyladenine glycosylase II